MQRTQWTDPRRSTDLNAPQKPEEKEDQNPKLTSKVSQLFSRRSNRESASDPSQFPIISPPSPRDESAPKKRTAGVFGALFKKGEQADKSASPVISRPARGVHSSSSSIVKKKEPVETLPEDKINPAGIRCFFAGAESQKNPLVRVLDHLHDMGALLSKLWEDANIVGYPLAELRIGLNRFERKKEEFEETILPQFFRTIEQRQSADREKTPQQDASHHEICRMFAKEPVDLNDGKESLDQILKHLIFMGRELIEVWNDPLMGSAGFEKIKREFDRLLIYPRFVSGIQQRKELCEIPTEKKQIEETLFSKIDAILQKKVYLDFKKPLKAEPNRSILKALSPGTEIIFKELDKIIIDHQESNKPKDGKGEVEIDEKTKLENDYVYLVAKYQLYKQLREQHRSAVQAIWVELDKLAKFQKNSLSLLKTDSAPNPIVNEMIALFYEEDEILKTCPINHPEVTIGSSRTIVMKEWLEEICGRIRYKYWDMIKGAMKKNDRALLIENIKLRPCSVPLFDELVENLKDELLSQTLVNPGNVLHEWMTPKSPGFIRCIADGKEVEPKTHNVTGRFEALLQTYSVFFGQPEMLSFLANLIGLPTRANKKNFIDDDLSDRDYAHNEVDYIETYQTFVNLGEAERTAIKQKFEQKYPTFPFEQVFDCFKLFQKVLGLEITRYFTKALTDARVELFSKIKGGLLQGYERLKKNEFNLSVNGSLCEIQIIRYDALLDGELLLRQEFWIVLDLKDWSLTLNKNKVSLRIECPVKLKEREDVKRLLLDLRLIGKALGFPPIKIL